MKKIKIGNLDTVFVDNSADDTCFILFHGYGANYQDLVPLSDFIQLKGNVDWVFPNAPLEVLVAPMMSGRAWFNIDVRALEAAMVQGAHRDLTQSRPDGMDYALDLASELVLELQKNYSKIILGGFSQGAMLATELTMRLENKPKALVILSGTLLDEKNWSLLSNGCSKVPFFQSHGMNDPLLNFKDAEKLNQLLKSAGLEGKFYAFKGGHEIPMDILKKLEGFLNSI